MQIFSPVCLAVLRSQFLNSPAMQSLQASLAQPGDPTCLMCTADPFSAPDMSGEPANEDPLAKAITVTVGIVGVGGSAVAGTAYALYKEVRLSSNALSQYTAGLPMYWDGLYHVVHFVQAH